MPKLYRSSVSICFVQRDDWEMPRSKTTAKPTVDIDCFRLQAATKLLEFSFPVTSKFFPSDKMPMDFESNAVHGSQVKINYTKYRVNAMSKDEHNKGPRKMQMKFESGQSSICPSPCPECSFFARFDCPRNPVACLRSIRSQNDQSWGQFAQ